MVVLVDFIIPFTAFVVDLKRMMKTSFSLIGLIGFLTVANLTEQQQNNFQKR